MSHSDSTVPSVRVAYIAGIGRSGSTLLELALGTLPGVCVLGEVVHLWERGVRDNELCACGRPFHDCPFWYRIGEDAFGGWQRVDVDEVLQLRRLVDRTRHVPRLLSAHPGTVFLRRVRAYDRLYRRIYTAARTVSGAQLVLDASKHVSLAACLHRDDDIDLRMLHVTRDSRGVAYSWSKHVRRPESNGAPRYMPRYSPTEVSLRWLAQNLLAEALAARGAPRMHVRYEDFVKRPQQILRDTAAFLGVAAPAGQPAGGGLSLPSTHTVAGNPLRFAHGRVVLRVDEEWRRSMPAWRQSQVGLLTAPLQARYGYLHRAPRGAAVHSPV